MATWTWLFTSTPKNVCPHIPLGLKNPVKATRSWDHLCIPQLEVSAWPRTHWAFCKDANKVLVMQQDSSAPAVDTLGRFHGHGGTVPIAGWSISWKYHENWDDLGRPPMDWTAPCFKLQIQVSQQKILWRSMVKASWSFRIPSIPGPGRGVLKRVSTTAHHLGWKPTRKGPLETCFISKCEWNQKGIHKHESWTTLHTCFVSAWFPSSFTPLLMIAAKMPSTKSCGAGRPPLQSRLRQRSLPPPFCLLWTPATKSTATMTRRWENQNSNPNLLGVS